MTKDLNEYKQPFDPDWPHGHTYSGHPARMICRDLKGGPYVFAIHHGQLHEEIRVVSINGSNGVNQVYNAPAPKRTWWANVYMTRSGVPSFYTFHTKEEAEKHADPRRLACVQITEGEGLE